jgi:hypothetical protein
MLCKTVANAFIDLCYVFVLAVCLSDVALVDAQTRVPPPPALGTRGTPGQVIVPPPPPGPGTRRTPVGPPAYSGRTPFPRKPPAYSGKTPFPPKPTQFQQEHPVLFNVGVITAVAALITAIAGLIRALRKGG